MTTPSSEPVATPPAKPTPRWEDFIDIFTSPTSVFERRKDQSPWAMMWIVTILISLVMILTFSGRAPVIENEMRAAMTKAMAKTPQLTQDLVDKQVSFSLIGQKWGVIIGFPIVLIIIAFFLWLVAKIVGSKGSYTQAVTVIVYGSIIGLLQAIVTGAEGLVMDVSNLTTIDQLSFSVARFMDKATASPFVYGLAKQLDVFGLWGLVVMVIGVQITGRVSRQKAITFGVIWFGIGTLIALGVAAWQAKMAGG